MRRRFEGTWNVVRFNWPMYALGCMVAAIALGAASTMVEPYRTGGRILGIGAIVLLVLPLVASYWIYDRSDLYRMPWLHGISPRTLLNLTAGFDESSGILARRFPSASLTTVDFFDPRRHTEPSIARARKAYPPFPGTIQLAHAQLPLPDHSVDLAVGFLALHEVRQHKDRVALLKEVRRILAPAGRMVVTEHLRDLPNALAFSVGVFHFLPDRSWASAFHEAGFIVADRHRTTLFITTYILRAA